ncbi:hypothetical protein PBI_BIGNUZ_57 [Mycobacterium phage BigNuz]|uniref:Uncharacterized protein n=1 Tax=Mycobacterium phage BigNuz TaxID=1074309 RepID=G1JX72_9CAUD|nr:hypothetical protein PBI_BIGNUZ_57 [Mycobacterium phage BigNuz]AEL98219.1 hypothetical protein PBI_BIGNUZ_57 [Mycobacterium phage BigNuz]
MNDPANEAAQRTFADMPGLAEPMEQPVFRALLNDVATSAARAALAPVREWSERHRGESSVVDDLLDDLAPLIYTTEELES